jgi:glycosyltransferase involved in cell wall biosynthesis
VTLPLFAVLPASVDDPAAPSGGNRYDREVLRRLPGTPAEELRPPEVSASPSHGIRPPEVSGSLFHGIRPLEVSGTPSHGIRPLGVSETPSRSARPLEVSDTPSQGLRPLEVSGGPSENLRPLEVSGGPSSERPAEVRPPLPAARKRQQDSPGDATGAVPPPAFHVREHLLGGTWPRPAEPDRRALAALLGDIPDDSLVLIDGLIACGVPDLLEPHATRLRLAVLVHLPLSDETGLTDRDAADLRALEARALRLAAAVIATSEPAARRVEELHGLTSVHAVAPGVDPAPLAEPSPTGHRLLNVASLTPRKGQDLLLTALQQLPDVPWTCTVAGAGRVPALDVPPPATLTLSTTGPLAPSWQTRRAPAPPGHTTAPAEALGENPDLAVAALGEHTDPAVAALDGAADDDTVRFVKALDGTPTDEHTDPTTETLHRTAADEHTVRFVGALVGAALDDVYANADLFVLPSRAETYGMVVTEALARGLPVVAADVGGVPEALGAAPGGGIPGRLIPPNDRDALAAALRDWLTDGELRERWRDYARARRATLTGWDETARRLARVLTGI